MLADILIHMPTTPLHKRRDQRCLNVSILERFGALLPAFLKKTVHDQHLLPYFARLLYQRHKDYSTFSVTFPLYSIVQFVVVLCLQ